MARLKSSHPSKGDTMPKGKTQFLLRIDDELYEKLKQAAEDDYRSVNNLIEVILKRYIQAKEESK